MSIYQDEREQACEKLAETWDNWSIPAMATAMGIAAIVHALLAIAAAISDLKP